MGNGEPYGHLSLAAPFSKCVCVRDKCVSMFICLCVFVLEEDYNS